MSVLELLKKVKIKTLSFEKHPCRKLEQEIMVHYINGLALVSIADRTISEKEKEYLLVFINTFGLNKNLLETFINFAENPDKQLILDMIKSFYTKDIRYNFMIDAMMIASIDSDFNENEKAVIDEYFQMLKISEKEKEDLKYIYEMFYTQNGNALYRYFKRNEYMKVELFQYLLDYYQIDMAYEVTEDEKKILTFEFFKPTFSSGSLANGATEIMTKPVNNAQFCIYLNSAFMNKTIEIDGNGKVVGSKSKDLLMDLDNSDIEFKDNKFIINNAKDEEKKVTGITYIIANIFIKWVNEYNNEKYQLSTFDGNYSVYFTSFKNMPDYEFIYRYRKGTYNSLQSINIGRLNLVSDSKYIDIRYDGNQNNYSLYVKNIYQDNKSSFRMMKLPKGEK